MTLAPVEIVVLEFAGNRFTGEILPELTRLVQGGTISLIDGVFAVKDPNGDVAILEFDDPDASAELVVARELFARFDGLLSAEDIDEFTEGLAPNSSVAVLVFEHSWVRPLRDAIVASGGRLADSVRIPGAVVEEVRQAILAADSE